ncbi:acyl-CoA thioesterase [Halogeometricum borinquense]|uniref:Acyl-CoA hydrolase n=2 Tax=Halogeometricum borinquense TaxID=60847 RepID=E4NNZ6_HALBP|nr:acyl-CoA thioesterase [Halogeometricum borinquense]ADQ66427.1 acyl-CoA hydrolase [Halogeometricum borinquense DSM 11551]ELY31147.1 acyl-CoA hydrolase [Halogeometricum borinquense DSM 11551]QIB75271.1 acyl-CoA thioesterase [Halogeometricum borinquense]QIQ75783.1 acyl-CoA thioesterase [Halogeometricum borinquense]RYJ15175.1 acyl-CoA thioesterase [Halogeometricum borinquense]
MIDIEETYIENRILVNPNDTNNYDMAHGGNVMKWMDEVGAMSAMRFAGETCVTARMESVNFHRPIPRGDAALIESYVYGAGTTSVKVRLRVFREDPLTGETELTTESYFVYVAIDEDGDPTTVPELETNTEYGRDLLEAALEGEKENNGHGDD